MLCRWIRKLSGLPICSWLQGERYIEQRSILMLAKILRLNQRLWQKCCIKTTCSGIFRGFVTLSRPKI